MPKCSKCGHLAVTPSMLEDHECDAHNDCVEYDDLADPDGLYA